MHQKIEWGDESYEIVGLTLFFYVHGNIFQEFLFVLLQIVYQIPQIVKPIILLYKR